MSNFVAESGLRGEIAWQDREDREEIARNQLAEQYANEWLEAVLNEPLDSFVTFQDRTVYDNKKCDFIERDATVVEVFEDISFNSDFSTRIAQIVIDAHKSGNQDATKLLEEMAVSFGESKV